MNAKEAREKSEQQVTVICKTVIDSIDKAIEVAANKGEMSCIFHETMNKEVQEYFNRRGFIIKPKDCDREDFSYEIIW